MGNIVKVGITPSAQYSAARAGLPAAKDQIYELPAELVPAALDLGGYVNHLGEIRLHVGEAIQNAANQSGVSDLTQEDVRFDRRPTDAAEALELLKKKLEVIRARAEEVTLRAKIEADLKARFKAEMVTWIQAQGSERLRLALELDIECEAVYRDERIAAERPGWTQHLREAAGISGDIDRWLGEEQEPRNPPLSALQALVEARKAFENVRLIYLPIFEDHYGEEGERSSDLVDGAYLLQTTFLRVPIYRSTN